MLLAPSIAEFKAVQASWLQHYKLFPVPPSSTLPEPVTEDEMAKHPDWHEKDSHTGLQKKVRDSMGALIDTDNIKKKVQDIVIHLVEPGLEWNEVSNTVKNLAKNTITHQFPELLNCQNGWQAKMFFKREVEVYNRGITARELHFPTHEDWLLLNDDEKDCLCEDEDSEIVKQEAETDADEPIALVKGKGKEVQKVIPSPEVNTSKVGLEQEAEEDISEDEEKEEEEPKGPARNLPSTSKAATSTSHTPASKARPKASAKTSSATSSKSTPADKVPEVAKEGNRKVSQSACVGLSGLTPTVEKDGSTRS